MQIWPAIDLRGGKCVRLRQGDFGRETVFNDDPAAMARHWVEHGAERLHLVDLDGARDGRPGNLASLRRILDAVQIECQVGGGVRDREAITQLLELGVARAIIGTKALKEPSWFAEMCHAFPNRLVLGIDARDGRVATDGWLKTSNVPATELISKLSSLPLAAIVYTDIATDGMLGGPNLTAMSELRRSISLPLIASGGVSTKEDVAQLAALGLDGCIIGRALYEGTLTLEDAITAARPS